MATEKKISELDPATSLSESDVVPGNQGSSTKKISITVLRTVLNKISQTFLGAITAPSFIGSGSQLTEVVKTSGDQNINGKLTANQLEGDGSLITGVTSAGVGGTSSTGSLSLIANSDNSTPSAKVVLSKFGTIVAESDENGFNIPTGSYKVNGEEILPPGVIGNINTPLLDYDLSHDTRKIIRGEGSDTLTRSTVQNIVNRYRLVKEVAIDNSGAEKNGTKYDGPITNKILHSEDFTNGVWTDPVGEWTVAGNNSKDPRGAINSSDTITLTSGPSDASLMRQVLTVATGSSFSLWVKLLAGSTTSMVFNHGAGTSVDVSGQLGGVGEWVRITAPEMTKGAQDWIDISMTGSVGATLSLWGAQFVELPIIGSYVSTTASPVTQTVNLSSFDYDGNVPPPEDNMTITMDMSIDGILSSSQFLLIIPGETSRYISINTLGKVNIRHGSIDVTSTTILTPGQLYRIIYANDGTNLSLYINGILENSIAQGIVTGEATGQVIIGASSVGGGNPLYGHVKTLKINDIDFTSSLARIA
jgi:hypothetical protein